MSSMMRQASLSGSLPVSQVDEAIRVAEATFKKIGGNREQIRKEARSYIANTLHKDEHLKAPAPKS